MIELNHWIITSGASEMCQNNAPEMKPAWNTSEESMDHRWVHVLSPTVSEGNHCAGKVHDDVVRWKSTAGCRKHRESEVMADALLTVSGGASVRI